MFIWMALIFVVGYLCIALEHPLKIDKAASALLTAVLCWTLLVFGADSLPGLSAGSHDPAGELRHHLGEIAEILFFLLGAMTIVELIDSHEGFRAITERIRTRKRVHLLWIVSLLTFFLSAVLDNLTTTIVMVSLLRKLVRGRPERWLYVGMVVIAANAGGAWSPIGDVTTTMLWIGNQITASGVISRLFLPSLVCLLVPLLILSLRLKGEAPRPRQRSHLGEEARSATSAFERNLVLALGLAALLFVPVFKTVTHLPPYMGILFGLGVLWVVTEVLHRGKNDEDKHPLSVVGVLRRIDTPSVLFFLGILLAVSSLASAGHLTAAAGVLRDQLGNVYAINYAIGLLSALVDNVPLVAGAMKMYPLTTGNEMAAGADSAWLGLFVVDGVFWEMLAYCAGTGGSSLIIGSAAGVAAMGMERISFLWYLKRISLLAFLGYSAGAATYLGLLALT